jgi:hypothetical protein
MKNTEHSRVCHDEYPEKGQVVCRLSETLQVMEELGILF